MKLLKSKIFIFIFACVSLLFFSNDFGLIDVEKTAIITAIAIDLNDGNYDVTAQIAVPEATDNNSEDKKALISSTGTTIGGALKNISNLSGWYPKLSFCNLIVLGQSFADVNAIQVVDYFAKTLRVQDSATIILAEKTAKELLEKSSPLDNISSFALQKILLKTPGFDKNVAAIDIKTFCADYYSDASSSRMPLVKIKETAKSDINSSESEGQPNGEGEQNEQNGQDGQCVFDATTTALFKHGVKVGTLNEQQTLTYNVLFDNTTETTVSVDGVVINGSKPTNFLLTILRNDSRINVSADEKINLTVDLSIYCKISDVNNDQIHEEYSYNNYVPSEVLRAAEKLFAKNIEEIIGIQKQTGCDVLGVKKQLYRKRYKLYGELKDDYLNSVNSTVNVKFSGKK